MKTRLPKSLLALVAYAAISTAQADVINPTTIWVKGGEMELGSKAIEGQYTLDVKDTANTATITKDVESASALFVRDGKLIIGGGQGEAAHNTVKINTANGASDQLDHDDYPTILNVAGKNATLVIDNATVTSDTETSMSVGGPDGNGTLIIQNGGKYLGNKQNFFFIGYQSGKEELGAQNIYDKFLVHATTNNTNDNIDKVENRFEGLYSENKVENREYGRGVVTVQGEGSLMETGMYGMHMGEGEVNILDGAVFNSNSYALGEKDKGGNLRKGGATSLGYVKGSTSIVNVKNGGVWNIHGQLHTGNIGVNSKTIINVEHGTVNLLDKRGSFLGLGGKSVNDYLPNGSTTEFNLGEGAKLNVSEEMYIGYVASAKLTVAKTAEINDFGNKNDSGEALDRLIVKAAGTIENAGKIDMLIDLRGGVVTMANGAKAADLTASAGTLSILGDVVFDGDVMLSKTGFLFTDGATIDLKGHDFSFDGGAVTIVVNAATPAVAMFSLEDEEMLASYGITFKNAGTVTGFEDDIEVTIATMGEDGQITETGAKYILKSSDVTVQSIPEPTTATLSLLALAGLAMRRRRK